MEDINDIDAKEGYEDQAVELVSKFVTKYEKAWDDIIDRSLVRKIQTLIAEFLAHGSDIKNLERLLSDRFETQHGPDDVWMTVSELEHAIQLGKSDELSDQEKGTFFQDIGLTDLEILTKGIERTLREKP